MPAPVGTARRGRILTSLLLLLLGVGVAPLLWTSYTLVSRSREIIQFNLMRLQHDKARSLSQQVATYVQSLKSQVIAIARTLEVDTARGELDARLERIQKAKGLERYVGEASPLNYVSVVNLAGRGPRSGVQLRESAIEQALEEGWRRGLEGKRQASHPVISASLQEPVMVLAEPVVPSGSESAQGVVLAVASLGPLWQMTQGMGERDTLDVYVVDGRGHLVAHSDPKRLEGNLDLSDVEIVKLCLAYKNASGTSTFKIESPTGPVQMLGTYTRVPDDSGWGVIVQVEQDKAYHDAIEMRNKSLGLVGVVAVLAIVFGTLFAGEISRPIQQLAAGARRLAGGDYATRVKVKSRNEVGVLAESFNHMGEEIERAIEEIRRAARVNKELFLGSIRMLANAIDEKDVYTRGHSERVAFYSAAIAKHLGMSAEDVEKVHLAGIIHDVGKIGIEDKILRKPAALTDEEYEIMKQHPRKGEHILEAVPMLKQMAGAGLMHHENVDGSGYPDGLKGDQIPLLGRIVSVADAFDAMTTERPYSKPMTFDVALARLRFLSGKKFDGQCVTAMEKAAAAGDLAPAKARRAAVASRQQAVVGAS